MDGVSGNAVVFGATGDVGGVLSRRLAARGQKLVVVGRDPDRTRALADEVDALPFTADVTQPDQVSKAFDYAMEHLGGIDGVANCAGSILLKPAHLTTDEEWASVIQVNLTGAFLTVRNATKAMRKNGGSIVLVSSAAASVGLVNHEAIAAAKAGVEGLVVSAASTYASRGIRVNAIAPGLVRSKMTERLTGNEESLKASTAMHPLGRIGEPDDIASAIDWLMDASSSWVTGQVIGVDGGLSRLRGRVRVG